MKIDNIAIQTCAPRADAAKRFLRSMEGIAPEGSKLWVHNDESMFGSLWNMEEIVKKADGSVLILEDDAIVPLWFFREAEACNFDGIMMNYMSGCGSKPLEWFNEGYHFIENHSRLGWTQAVFWPNDIRVDYLKWLEDQIPCQKRGADDRPEDEFPEHRKFNRSDTSIRKYLSDRKGFQMIPLPNLVQHQVWPSMLGHSTNYKGKPRVTQVFGESLLPSQWDKSKIKVVK